MRYLPFGLGLCLLASVASAQSLAVVATPGQLEALQQFATNKSLTVNEAAQVFCSKEFTRLERSFSREKKRTFATKFDRLSVADQKTITDLLDK